MKNIFLTDGFGGGGAEIVFIALLNRLSLGTEEPILAYSLRSDTAAINVVKPRFNYSILSRYRLVSFLKLFVILLRSQPSVVISSMKWANFVNLFFAKILGHQAIIWVHNTDEGRFEFLYRYLITPEVTVVAASSSIKIKCQKLTRNTLYISNILNAQDITYKKKRPRYKNKFVYIASFTEQKNHSFLLKVWLELIRYNPNLKLDLYGDGPEKAAILQQISTLKLFNSVKIIGFDPKVSKKLHRYDYMLHLPSWEGFGMSVSRGYLCGASFF